MVDSELYIGIVSQVNHQGMMIPRVLRTLLRESTSSVCRVLVGGQLEKLAPQLVHLQAPREIPTLHHDRQELSSVLQMMEAMYSSTSNKKNKIVRVA